MGAKEIAFWEAVAAGKTDARTACKKLGKLPADLSPTLVAKVYAFLLASETNVFWNSLGATPDAHAKVLVDVLRQDAWPDAEVLIKAYDHGSGEGLREAASFFAFVGKSIHLPGLFKRLPQLEPSKAFRAAATEIMKRPDAINLPLFSFWALLWVASLDDARIVDADQPFKDPEILARFRVAMRPGAKRPKTTTPTSKSTAGPLRVSEVTEWLADHPDVDPALLARTGKQKATARAAAIRALAVLGTQRALDVLVTYGPTVARDDENARIFGPRVEHEGPYGDTFPEPVAVELVAAWSRFDRHAFATALFSAVPSLRLWNAGPLESIDGIGAATELVELRVRLSPDCDLAPLAACTALEWLELNASARNSHLDSLSKLPALARLGITLENGSQSLVDGLASLAKVERLRVVLDADYDLTPLLEMTSLRRLMIGHHAVKPSTGPLDVVEKLARRGVDVRMYAHDEWPLALRGREGLTCIELAGYVALTNDAARREELEVDMRLNLFLDA